MLIYNVVLITTVQLSYSVKRVCAHSVVSDSVTLWSVAHQDPLSMGFFRQEHWNGLSFPSPIIYHVCVLSHSVMSDSL